jgi:pimeloyl-ACP methyl ester carboxylesterase
MRTIGEIGSFRATAVDGTEIALHRVPGSVPGGAPVLLAPGTFSTRMFWLGQQGQGFGFALARAGFDPWVIELRGHGQSARPPHWTMDDWIRFDAPAAIELVLRETGSDHLFWIGHSAGGVVGAAFAGSGHPLVERIRGTVLLGAPGPAGLRGFRRLGAWATMLATGAVPALRLPGRPLRLGPEHEPGGLIRDWMHWNISGRWRGSGGQDYLAGMADARHSVLAVAGAGDRLLAPPVAVRDLLHRFGSTDRTLIVAGRSTGYSVDYDHPGLVIGRPAREEIWPRVVEWLRGRSREPAATDNPYGADERDGG